MNQGMEFFERYSRLAPRAYVANGEGTCPCGRTGVTIYENGTRRFCCGGVMLRQVYPMLENKPDNRLQDSSYMLITETSTYFWGKFPLEKHYDINRRTDQIASVKRALILAPPPTPWMFISFTKSNQCDRLFVTTSPDILWFSGKTMFRGLVVDRVDRRQVIAIAQTGITSADWKKLQVARRGCAEGNRKAFAAGKEVIEKYPSLSKVVIPPRRSAEAVAIESVLQDDV